MAVTTQIERSFSDNGRQPTVEDLAIAKSVRAAVRSSTAYLATTDPVQAQIAGAHAQLMAAFSKEMADADGEMLAEYGPMDAMEPLVGERSISKNLPTITQDLSRRSLATRRESVSMYPRRPKVEALA